MNSLRQPIDAIPTGVRRRSFGGRRNPESHAAIVGAVKALLREQGPSAATIDAIARRAGASKPTIYRWWPSRAHLLVEVYEGEIAGMAPTPELGSVERELFAARREVWRVWRETVAGQAFVALVAEAQIRPEAADVLRERLMPARRAGTEAIFARGIARGEIDPDADIERLVDATHGFDWYRLLTGQIEDDPNCIRTVIRQQLRGASRRDADVLQKGTENDD